MCFTHVRVRYALALARSALVCVLLAQSSATDLALERFAFRARDLPAHAAFFRQVLFTREFTANVAIRRVLGASIRVLASFRLARVACNCMILAQLLAASSAFVSSAFFACTLPTLSIFPWVRHATICASIKNAHGALLDALHAEVLIAEIAFENMVIAYPRILLPILRA